MISLPHQWHVQMKVDWNLRAPPGILLPSTSLIHTSQADPLLKIVSRVSGPAKNPALSVSQIFTSVTYLCLNSKRELEIL